MPQTFVALQCAFCSTYQAQQDKKGKTFTCVICHAKQSFRKVFAISHSGKDIRLTVQQLNELRGAADEAAGDASLHQLLQEHESQQAARQAIEAAGRKQHQHQQQQGWDEFLGQPGGEGGDEDDADVTGFVTAVADGCVGGKRQHGGAAAAAATANGAGTDAAAANTGRHIKRSKGYPTGIGGSGSSSHNRPPVSYQPRPHCSRQQPAVAAAAGASRQALRGGVLQQPRSGVQGHAQGHATAARQPAATGPGSSCMPSRGLPHLQPQQQQQPCGHPQPWHQLQQPPPPSQQHQQHVQAAAWQQPSGQCQQQQQQQQPPPRRQVQPLPQPAVLQAQPHGSSTAPPGPYAQAAWQGAAGAQAGTEPRMPGAKAAADPRTAAGAAAAAPAAKGAWAAFVDEAEETGAAGDGDDSDGADGGGCFVTEFGNTLWG